MNTPLVSICCICYNQEAYIRQTLDGFLKQRTDFAFEIVVSDDCSTDETHTIILEYLSKYHNVIRDVSPNKNLGIFGNFFNVINHAMGDYIAFCEGDDFWTNPDKLQKQVDFLNSHPQYDLCYTDFSIFNEIEGRTTPDVFKSNYFSRPVSFEQHLLRAAYIAPMTWLMRKSTIPSIKRHIDLSFCYALEYFALSKVAYIDVTTSMHIIHPGSATKEVNQSSRLKYLRDVVDIQYEYAEKFDITKRQISSPDYDKAVLLAGKCAILSFRNKRFKRGCSYILFCLKNIRNPRIVLKAIIHFIRSSIM